MIKTEADRKEYWAERLRHFLGSGLSQRGYARQQGICVKSLRKWSQRLEISLRCPKMGSSSGSESPFSFVEISGSSCSAPLFLRLDLPMGKGQKVKVEMSVLWDQAAHLLKALSS